MMKVTLITPSFNNAGTIGTTLDSVLSQRRADVEYIVVDGGSTDGTVEILKDYEKEFLHIPTNQPPSFRWISEKDRGMYDAINKGISMATGDIVGILNSDDILASDDTLAHVVAAFAASGGGSRMPNVDCVYADIRFVRSGDTVGKLRTAKVSRYCSARFWRPWMFRFGAMVPHPSFYVRRECFSRLGGYSLDYRICADFELELRYLYLAKLRAVYLPECVVVMRTGGASTSGWRSTVEINREDMRALRANGVWSCLPLIYLKYLFKIWGFVFKNRTP